MRITRTAHLLKRDRDFFIPVTGSVADIVPAPRAYASHLNSLARRTVPAL
ncbi:hypothetical protein HALA3H3_770026 [Halomonas sp. A3H3]|nr:conserved hypothetical protein [Halomonas sp. 113]CDG54442.1 hypothetical protein HALA3H3_770026 [Halomonas sp. A3H3]VXB96853.1 conserved hypothetical protein [Halomonas titanicae]